MSTDGLANAALSTAVVPTALQLVILVGMIAVRAIPLVTGQIVLVKVQPVDPRDLFRGDYVILSYDFSRISPEGIEGLSQTECTCEAGRRRW
jgi:uncharacterized membrane-anchored protein